MKKNDTVKGINKFVLPLWEMELRGAWELPCPYSGANPYPHLEGIRWEDAAKQQRNEAWGFNP
ncbi:MAG: hypothetical protein AAB296_07010, partial [Candidatus Desantisbacteria bacterium]